jgi:glycosyltransferase involved in cell wall biosynthesis
MDALVPSDADACFLIPTDMFLQPSMPAPYERAWKQAQLLQVQGRRVAVVSWIRWTEGPLTKLPATEERDGLRIQRVFLAPPKKGLVARAAFFRTLSRAVADAARATGAGGFVVHDPELLRAGLAAAGRRTPVFYDAHEHFPAMVAQHHPLEARLFDLLERSAARRLAHVYTVSKGIAARFEAMGVPTTVLYNSKALATVQGWRAPRAAARVALGAQDDEFIVGFLGSLTGEEGMGLLLDALERAPPKVRLVAHGGPAKEADRWQADAAARGLGARACIRGPVSPKELYQRLSGADVGAMLLANAGANYELRAPNKLFDYMALGLPILATDLPEPRELVEGTGAGVVVERTPQAVADALRTLASDPGKAMRLGQSGQAAFASRFCWERMEDRLRASHPFWAGQ